MQVTLDEPYFWFLLEDGEQCYLDVSCSQSAATFTIALMLSDDELRDYRLSGKPFIQQLAEKIQYSPRAYHQRNLPREMQDRILAAILAWRGASAQ